MRLYKLYFYISLLIWLVTGCVNTGQRVNTQYGVCYENPYYYQDLPDEWYEWEKYNWHHSCNRLRNSANRPRVNDNGNGQPGEVIMEENGKVDLFYDIDRDKRYHYSNPIIRNLK